MSRSKSDIRGGRYSGLRPKSRRINNDANGKEGSEGGLGPPPDSGEEGSEGGLGPPAGNGGEGDQCSNNRGGAFQCGDNGEGGDEGGLGPTPSTSSTSSAATSSPTTSISASPSADSLAQVSSGQQTSTGAKIDGIIIIVIAGVTILSLIPLGIIFYRRWKRKQRHRRSIGFIDSGGFAHGPVEYVSQAMQRGLNSFKDFTSPFKYDSAEKPVLISISRPFSVHKDADPLSLSSLPGAYFRDSRHFSEIHTENNSMEFRYSQREDVKLNIDSPDPSELQSLQSMSPRARHPPGRRFSHIDSAEQPNKYRWDSSITDSTTSSPDYPPTSPNSVFTRHLSEQTLFSVPPRRARPASSMTTMTTISTKTRIARGRDIYELSITQPAFLDSRFATNEEDEEEEDNPFEIPGMPPVFSVHEVQAKYPSQQRKPINSLISTWVREKREPFRAPNPIYKGRIRPGMGVQKIMTPRGARFKIAADANTSEWDVQRMTTRVFDYESTYRQRILEISESSYKLRMMEMRSSI